MKHKIVVCYDRNRCQGDDAIMCDFAITDPNMGTEESQYMIHYERDAEDMAAMSKAIAEWVGKL